MRCGEGLAEAENGVLFIDQDVPDYAYFNCHQLTGITVKIGPNAASLRLSATRLPRRQRVAHAATAPLTSCSSPDEQESRLERRALLEHRAKDSINATRIHPMLPRRGHSDGCRRDTVS